MSDLVVDGQRRCGRPTKSGRPCHNVLYGAADLACGVHATESDRLQAKAYSRGWSAGWDARGEGRAGALQSEFERGYQQALREGRAPWRSSEGGDQVVEVDRYAYRWSGPEPLAVGDVVLIPGNWVTRARGHQGPIEGMVTALGSAYQGQLSSVIRRLRQEAS